MKMPIMFSILDGLFDINLISIDFEKVGNLTIICHEININIFTTSQFPQVHIICDAEKSKINFDTVEKNLVFDGLIHVHSNGFKTSLIILSPFNYNQIRLHDERKFSIKYSYQAKKSICIYKSDESFCFSELRIKYDDFSLIELIEADHLDIELVRYRSLF